MERDMRARSRRTLRCTVLVCALISTGVIVHVYTYGHVYAHFHVYIYVCIHT